MIQLSKFIMIVVLGIVLGSCSHKAESHTEQGHAEETVDDGHGHAVCAPLALTLSHESKETMGLTLETAAYRNLAHVLAVTGEAAKDTDRVFHVLAGVSGVVGELGVKYGDVVNTGSPLAVIHSEGALSSAEVRAPHGGMVSGVAVSPGQRVESVTSLVTISDFSVIYANFDVYEKDAGKVRLGQKIKVTSVAYPGKVFNGNISFVSPRIDEISRTIKVRAEIANTNYQLKHSMFLEGAIVLSEGSFLAVPAKAVQRSGDKTLVFVSKTDDSFEVREVQIGTEDSGYVQIIKGLRSGEKVAAEGSFLLKSEMLKSKMGDGCAE
jgi:multidrug efflux pump subunit AcrA (membrane-fusion protein)